MVGHRQSVRSTTGLQRGSERDSERRPRATPASKADRFRVVRATPRVPRPPPS